MKLGICVCVKERERRWEGAGGDRKRGGARGWSEE